MLNIFQKIMRFSFLLFIVFSIPAGMALAQTAATDQSASIELAVSPTSPQPGDSVTLDVSSFSMDLDSANITWYVDGVSAKQGYGDKELVIQAKGNGDGTAIKVVAESADGTTAQTTTEITPAGVDLILEPTSYVPPFYKGKALFIDQGTARLVAIPDVFVNGAEVSPDDLTFEWEKDGTALASDSGRGADSLIVNGTVPIRDINISVTVLNASGVIVAQSSKIISATDPKILFYEDNPLYGILFNKAITGNYYLGQTEEFTAIAKPYFFNLKSDSGTDSTYKWTVNGNAVDPSGQTNELLLQQTTSNLEGTADISVDVNNVARIFQFATAGFSVTFGL